MTIKNSTSQSSINNVELGEEEIIVPPVSSEVIVEDGKPSAPPCPSTLPDEPDIAVGPPSPSNTTAKALDEDTSTAVASITTNDTMEEANFPHAFYCPLTKKVMVDPVVHPSGDSYEKAAAVEQEERNNKGLLVQTKLYPNRALKAYIEHELERFEEAGSMRGTIRKIDDTLRSGWDMIVDKTGVPLGEFRPLPDEFYCTLTLDLCHEPVVDPDGYTYEREAIVHWVQNNADSPVTRKALSVDQLYDNNAVLNILLEESEKPEDDIHPCIRRWKEDMSNPTPTSIVPVDNGENPNYTLPYGHGIAMNGDPNRTPGQQHPFPTNREQMDERMRQQHRMSMISLILIIVVISFALVYLPFYLVVFCMAFCSCMFARRRFQERRMQR